MEMISIKVEVVNIKVPKHFYLYLYVIVHSVQKVPHLFVASLDGHLYIYSLDVHEGGDCRLAKKHR